MTLILFRTSFVDVVVANAVDVVDVVVVVVVVVVVAVALVTSSLLVDCFVLSFVSFKTNPSSSIGRKLHHSSYSG